LTGDWSICSRPCAPKSGRRLSSSSRPCWKPRPKCQAAPATAPVITPPKTKPPGADAGRLAGGQV